MRAVACRCSPPCTRSVVLSARLSQIRRIVMLEEGLAPRSGASPQTTGGDTRKLPPSKHGSLLIGQSAPPRHPHAPFIGKANGVNATWGHMKVTCLLQSLLLLRWRRKLEIHLTLDRVILGRTHRNVVALQHDATPFQVRVDFLSRGAVIRLKR